MFQVSILFLKNQLINLLFLAALGLRCCAQAFSSCSEQGYSLLRCMGFSLPWLLLLRSMGSRHAAFSSGGWRALERRLSSCGARAQLLRGMWDFPRPGLEPISPALAGRFLTTAPPGKSTVCILIAYIQTIYLLSLRGSTVIQTHGFCQQWQNQVFIQLYLFSSTIGLCLVPLIL